MIINLLNTTFMTTSLVRFSEERGYCVRLEYFQASLDNYFRAEIVKDGILYAVKNVKTREEGLQAYDWFVNHLDLYVNLPF